MLVSRAYVNQQHKPKQTNRPARKYSRKHNSFHNCNKKYRDLGINLARNTQDFMKKAAELPKG